MNAINIWLQTCSPFDRSRYANKMHASTLLNFKTNLNYDKTKIPKWNILFNCVFFQFCRSEIVEEGRKYISEFRSRRRRHVPRRRWDGGRGTPDALTRDLLAISVVTMISWSDASLRTIGVMYCTSILNYCNFLRFTSLLTLSSIIPSLLRYNVNNIAVLGYYLADLHIRRRRRRALLHAAQPQSVIFRSMERVLLGNVLRHQHRLGAAARVAHQVYIMHYAK